MSHSMSICTLQYVYYLIVETKIKIFKVIATSIDICHQMRIIHNPIYLITCQQQKENVKSLPQGIIEANLYSV